MVTEARNGVPVAVPLLLGCVLGLVQFALFFSDLPGAPALSSRVVAAATLAAVSGVALGRLRPGAWLPLSLLAVWGAIVWGVAFGAMRVSGWAAALIVPAALAALGGLAGTAWARRRMRSPGAGA